MRPFSPQIAIKAGAAWLLAVLLLVWSPAMAGAAQGLERVSVRLQWVHQAQFAGFYVALDQGLYQKAGLDVEVLPVAPDALHPLEELCQGDVDFAMAWLSEAMVRRAQGLPIVNLAQLVQRSAMLLVTWEGRGLENVRDLAGRRVGFWQSHFAVAPRALFSQLGITVQEVNQVASIAPFLNRAVDAASAMLYNEYHMLYQAGVDLDEVRIFECAKLGINFPEDGIYTRRATWQRNPDLCRRFVQATLDGWRLALADPEKALDSVMKRVDESRLASNRAHQTWMLKVMGQIITHRVGQENMGQLDPGDLEQANKVLVEQGFLERPITAAELVAPAWGRP